MTRSACSRIAAVVALTAMLGACGGGDDDATSDAAGSATDGSNTTVASTTIPTTTSTTTPATTATGDTITAKELSQEGNVLVVDDEGFHPATIVVGDDSCDTGGCSATFDLVNEGTTTHTFTIDDSHFPQDWLDSYGSVDWEVAPGETAGGVYVSYLPGDTAEINAEELEFSCRIHPSLRGRFVRSD